MASSRPAVGLTSRLAHPEPLGISRLVAAPQSGRQQRSGRACPPCLKRSGRIEPTSVPRLSRIARGQKVAPDRLTQLR